MKAYVKPELFYEDFQLSTHIASCTFSLNSGNVYTCTEESTGQGTFAVDNCETGLSEKQIEEYCYTGYAGGKIIFMS